FAPLGEPSPAVKQQRRFHPPSFRYVRGGTASRCRPSLSVHAYFSSTLAPASSSCFLIFSASSLFTPSFTGLGAPSTRSLASFKPRPVIARTSLMTLIFLSPATARITSKLSFTSAAGAAAPPPAAAATATGAAA